MSCLPTRCSTEPIVHSAKTIELIALPNCLRRSCDYGNTLCNICIPMCINNWKRQPWNDYSMGKDFIIASEPCIPSACQSIKMYGPIEKLRVGESHPKASCRWNDQQCSKWGRLETTKGVAWHIEMSWSCVQQPICATHKLCALGCLYKIVLGVYCRLPISVAAIELNRNFSQRNDTNFFKRENSKNLN